MEAFKNKERHDETQFTTNIDGFWSFTPHPPPPPPPNVTVFFCKFFKNLTLCMKKHRVLMLCLFYFMDNSIVLTFI